MTALVTRPWGSRGRRAQYLRQPEQLPGPRARIRKVGRARRAAMFIGIDVAKRTRDRGAADGGTLDGGHGAGECGGPGRAAARVESAADRAGSDGRVRGADRLG